MKKCFILLCLFLCIAYSMNYYRKANIVAPIKINSSRIEMISASVFSDWIDIAKKYFTNMFSANKQMTDQKINEGSEMSEPELLHPTKTILILGDSLTEGYGLQKTEAFPWLVEQDLNKKFPECNVKIINGGISGSTSAGALSRLQRHFERLDQKPNLVMVALGANDGLRGLSLEDMQKNLQEAITWVLGNEVRVTLAGMKIPLNYGFAYSSNFSKVFSKLAKKNELEFIPFLLKGVAMKAHLNLSDGIHPNAEGHKVIAQTVFPYFKSLCK